MTDFNCAVRRVVWAAAAAAVTWVPVVVGQVPPTTLPTTVAPAAPTPPAVADIQACLERKQYVAAVRAASRLLALRGDAAAGFSRFQVAMLKGDAQVGSHALAAARATYHDAIRETRDPHEKALATWTGELFRQAKGTVYVPHVAAAGGAGNAPIDLTDPENRKAAFSALLDDQLSLLGPQLKQAAGSSSLPQILPVVKQVQSLAELDEIASGTDARTTAAAGALLDHARNLMANALKGMWTRTGDIYSSATQTVTGSGGTMLVNGQPVQQTVTSQNGLSQRDADELRAMIDTCGKIGEAAATFAPLAHGTDDKGWGAILNDATRVAGRAHDVLTSNYSSPMVSSQYPPDGTGYGNNNGVGILGNGLNGNVYYPPGTNGGYSGVFPTNGGGYLPKPPTAPAPPPTGPGSAPPAGTGGGSGGTGGAVPAPRPIPRGVGNGVTPPTGRGKIQPQTQD